MIIYDLSFKNSGQKIFNDIIGPGSPFLVDNFSYRFTINPKSPFWRFGIRLSKTEKIIFSNAGNRHNSGDGYYRDIHLSAGERLENAWVNPNTIHLVRYNFPDNRHEVMDMVTEYVAESPVDFFLDYDSEKSILNVSWVIRANNNNTYSWGTSIFLEPEFKYFQVFVWADKIDFDLNCSFLINELNDNGNSPELLNPFRVGNITFRLGDMFDSYAKNNSDVILLPASTYGTAKEITIENAIQLGIPPRQLILPKGEYYYMT